MMARASSARRRAATACASSNLAGFGCASNMNHKAHEDHKATFVSFVFSMVRISRGSPMFDLRPRVAQRHRSVEHERVRPRIGVDAEVAQALELHPQSGRRRREARLEPTVPPDIERGG